MSTDNRDAPQTAARRLLQSGEWVSAADLAAHLGDRIPETKAEQCYGRLVRAGHKPAVDRAARLNIGRERLCQEAFQRLVQRGEAEADGTGDGRRYRRLTQSDPGAIMFARPKPRKEWVPFDRLTFDPRLQMRDIRAAGGKWVTTNEEWVEHLLELRREKVDLEPLEAVEETRKGKQPVLWVFRGFHRGEARRRNGEVSVEVLIYPGTFADAQFYALSENGRQPLPRDEGSCQRAFDTLIDTPGLWKRVAEAAGDQGGVYRAICAATGISKGGVGNCLKRRGLCVDRKSGKLVPVAEPVLTPPPPPPISPARAEPDGDDQEEDTDETPAPSAPPAIVSATDADPIMSGAKDTLANLAKLLRSVGRDVESLLRSPVGDKVRAAARCAKLPFDVREEPLTQHINDPGIGTRRIETWPTLATMQAVFSQVSADIA